MFKAITEFGVTGRAVKHNLLQVECWNPRDFTFDKHKTVDDRPYGCLLYTSCFDDTKKDAEFTQIKDGTNTAEKTETVKDKEQA